MSFAIKLEKQKIKKQHKISHIVILVLVPGYCDSNNLIESGFLAN